MSADSAVILDVRAPLTFQPEREYVIRTVFEHFLGQRVLLRHEPRANTVVRVGEDASELVLEDGLFAIEPGEWLSSRTVPEELMASWAPPPSLRGSFRHATIPIFFASPSPSGQFAQLGPTRIRLTLDVLGTVFYLLTRYEEVAQPVHDARSRYPSSAALLTRSSLLHRPVVDEYVELVWTAMSLLWRQLRRAERSYRFILTHDVDRPLCVDGAPYGEVGRQVMGDLVRRKDLHLAARRLRSLIETRTSGARADLCNNFSWIMGESERRGIRSEFYFLSRTGQPIDANYSPYDAPIASTMREINARGHAIGLHPSYDSYTSADRIASEFTHLREAAEQMGIEQETWGGRQHYLRWKAPETWQHWSDAGLAFDSTVGFADAAGFRCGTCVEFPVFNLRTRRQLALRERPLIVMEETLLSEVYAGLSRSAALSVIEVLADECKHHNGDFVMLWHNSSLLSRRDRRAYCAALDAAAQGGAAKQQSRLVPHA